MTPAHQAVSASRRSVAYGSGGGDGAWLETRCARDVTVRWIVDGNNVYGSRPDGWWNDRAAAATRFAQCVAEWCRTHDEQVTIVFDAPVAESTATIAGGNLRIVEARRRGRDGADHEIVAIVDGHVSNHPDEAETTVVTSDRGLRARLPARVRIEGVGRFRNRVGY